jgi:DNA polymerase-3 subunit epsilon
MRHVREISLDTETTGLTPKDRIIEIACVEIVNRVKTGNNFHTYINPMVPISEGAAKVHGITDEMVADKEIFASIAPKFLEFIGNSTLIIHNAEFDLGFLNKELGLLGHNLIDRARVIDTLKMARQKFPGSPASLDALCKRFSISLEERDKHGALIDAELLTHVYLHLTGSTQGALEFTNEQGNFEGNKVQRKPRPLRTFVPSQLELNEHLEFLEKIKNPIWKKKIGA